jgi:PAS domain S-box-containing protein
MNSATKPTSRTALVVEDSPVQAEVLRRALEGAGFHVLMAGDGAEGLALARENHPDAVVSDITMPVMDGYAMCKAIRSDKSLKSTPVILLTMLSDPEDVLLGLNAGADAYVTKPYNIPSLVARIASLLSCPPAQPPDPERRMLQVLLDGQARNIDAHGPRMLNLLISTYENAVLQNRELTATQQALEDLNQHLEQRVLEQTKSLQASEQRYRGIFTESRDGIVLIDAETGLVADCNPEFERQCGRPLEQMKRLHIWELRPAEVQETARAKFQEVKNKIAGDSYELPLQWPDGRVVPIEFRSTRMHLGDRDYLQSTSRDITERKRAAAQLTRLNWALRALGQSNSALVHAGTESELFQSCCNAIAGGGGYPLAWIGLALNDVPHSVAIAAAAGEASEFVNGLKVTWADEPLGRGPTGTAIRTGETQVVNDLAQSTAYLPWIASARAHGLASSISLPIRGNGTALGILVVCSRAADAFGQPEVDLFEELAADIGYGIVSRRTLIERDQLQREQLLGGERLKSALIGTIGAVALTVEKRDPYTAGHQRRVAELSVAIGREMNLSPDSLEGLRLGATIHDIGKVSVPAEILNRPGKLAELEFALIKTHPQVGYDIVKDVQFPWPVAEMVLQHHERLDGSGYPRKLVAAQIILEARILAVADVVEAMSSHRPYRAGLGTDIALAEIERGRETLYDPAVADACLRLFREHGYAIPA